MPAIDPPPAPISISSTAGAVTGSAVDGGSLPPDYIVALRRFVEAQRGTLDGYDIIVGGRKRSDDWEGERARIRAVAGAGATWWCEYIPPAEITDMRAAIARGPLRI